MLYHFVLSYVLSKVRYQAKRINKAQKTEYHIPLHKAHSTITSISLLFRASPPYLCLLGSGRRWSTLNEMTPQPEQTQMENWDCAGTEKWRGDRSRQRPWETKTWLPSQGLSGRHYWEYSGQPSEGCCEEQLLREGASDQRPLLAGETWEWRWAGRGRTGGGCYKDWLGYVNIWRRRG